MLKILALLFTAASAPAVFASTPLVLLPIKDVQHTREGNTEQVVVTFDYQACKYTYKGLYLEQIAQGQGQARFEVRVLGSERIEGSCADASVLRTDSISVNAPGSERYEFIPVKVK